MIRVIPKCFKEWYVICNKVKYLVSCCGRLVSLTLYMYEYEYDMPWLRMLNPFSLVCMNGMRRWMMLRGSFIWNLEPCDKVMNFVVESHNGILLIMNDGLMVVWMEQHHINP